MKKREVYRHQVLLLSVASIIAVAIVVAAGFIIVTQIKMKNSTDDIKTPQMTMGALNSSSSTVNSDLGEAPAVSSKAESTNESKVDAKVFGAVEYINCTGNQILELFKNHYEEDGYYNGGVVIYNYMVCPNMEFVMVMNDDKIADKKIARIVVSPPGMVLEKVFVGMTYPEIKNEVKDKISGLAYDSTDDCNIATIDEGTFTIRFQFNKVTGKSEYVMLINK